MGSGTVAACLSRRAANKMNAAITDRNATSLALGNVGATAQAAMQAIDKYGYFGGKARGRRLTA